MRSSGGRIFYGYYLVAMAFFLGFVYSGVYTHSRGVFVRGQIEDFDVSRTEISLAFSLVQIAGALVAPFFGYVLDRFRVRDVMTCGAIWLGIGFLVMSRVDTVWQFAILMTLFMGLGSASLGSSANSRLLVNWFDRYRGMVLSVSVMGYSTAGVVIPPVAVWMLDGMGWQNAYLIFGWVLLLVIAPMLFLIVRQRPQDFGLQPDGLTAPGSSLARRSETFGVVDDRQILPAQPAIEAVTSNSHDYGPNAWAAFALFARSRAFWGAVLLFGSLAGVLISLNVHLFLHYTGLALGDYQAAMILSVTGLCLFVSKPVFGWLIDRLGALRASMMTVVAGVVTMLVFSVATTLLPLLLAGVLLGFAFGAVVPLQAALLSRIFDPALYGRAYGALRLSIFPMTVTFTPLTGLIWDRTGSYAPAFVAFALLFLVVALLAPRMFSRDRIFEHAARERR